MANGESNVVTAGYPNDSLWLLCDTNEKGEQCGNRSKRLKLKWFVVAVVTPSPTPKIMWSLGRKITRLAVENTGAVTITIFSVHL